MAGLSRPGPPQDARQQSCHVGCCAPLHAVRVSPADALGHAPCRLRGHSQRGLLMRRSQCPRFQTPACHPVCFPLRSSSFAGQLRTRAASPPAPPPSPAGPLLLTRRAARARGSACKRRPGRFPRTPLSARAMFSRRILAANVFPQCLPSSVVQTVYKARAQRPAYTAADAQSLLTLGSTSIRKHFEDLSPVPGLGPAKVAHDGLNFIHPNPQPPRDPHASLAFLASFSDSPFTSSYVHTRPAAQLARSRHALRRGVTISPNR